MSQWFIRDRNELDGPYTLNELKTLLREGELEPEDEVQEGQRGEPVAARDVPELRSAASGSRRPQGNASGSSSGAMVWIIIAAVFAGVFVLGCLLIVPALMLPAVQQVREAARRSQSQDNLHNMVIGVMDYEMTYRKLPPGGVTDAAGNEYHGWQTFILPFINQKPLYTSMDVDNSRWTDPVIDPWTRTVIPIYQHASIPDLYTASGQAATHYSANNRVMYENSNVGLADVVDGTSFTLCIGEIATDFPPWAGVRNYRDPVTGLTSGPGQFGGPVGGSRGEGAQFALLDGRVSFISDSIDPGTLEGLATPDGGEMAIVP
jgi:hypothetical protein